MFGGIEADSFPKTPSLEINAVTQEKNSKV